MTALRRLVIALALAVPSAAGATRFSDVGATLGMRPESTVTVHGAVRVRGEAMVNLDLDRGLTPSGQALYPIPAGDPTGQTLTHGDLRLRTDVDFVSTGGGVAGHVSIDVLDVTMGSDATGIPAASTRQEVDRAVHVRHAWGEALTPFGVIAAGRMGSDWGLGILANAGNCLDCDGGDSADRIAFVTPLGGMIWAVAFDVSWSGPTVGRASMDRELDFDPTDDVRTITFATMRWRSDWARERRRRAGKSTIDWGAYGSHRWQDNDVPAEYLPLAGAEMDGVVTHRGYRATAVDGWLRLTFPMARIEAEAAVLIASVDEPSLVPGVSLREPVESLQYGGALESEFGDPTGSFTAGIDAGYASGDPAPGFGAFPTVGAPPPQPGDLEGAQAGAPGDRRVDNLRFHPNYRVDRILWREIVGAVTDGMYVRPHVNWIAVDLPQGRLTANAAAIASFAVEPSSAPGGEAPLGVEIDPTLTWQSRDGLVVSAEYAILFPLAGLDGVDQAARPAQLFRLWASFGF